MDVNELITHRGMQGIRNDSFRGRRPTGFQNTGLQPVWFGEVQLDEFDKDAGGVVWYRNAEFQLYCVVNEAWTVFLYVYAASPVAARRRLLSMYPHLEFM